MHFKPSSRDMYAPRAVIQTHLAQRAESLIVAIPDLPMLAPSIPPVPVEDESNMSWYRARRKNRDEGIAGSGFGLVSEPTEGGRDEVESHVVGKPRRDASRFFKFHLPQRPSCFLNLTTAYEPLLRPS